MVVMGILFGAAPVANAAKSKANNLDATEASHSSAGKLKRGSPARFSNCPAITVGSLPCRIFSSVCCSGILHTAKALFALTLHSSIELDNLKGRP